MMASFHFDEISYAEIITILKVAQTLNMSIAAKELHVSQPAVSKRIASFEKKYGLILFVRTGRHLQLTPAGKAFYQEVLASQKHLQAAFLEASAKQSTPSRILSLYYDGFFDLPLLKEIIDEFSSSCGYDRSGVRIYYGHKEDCSDLFTGEADLMLCPDSFTHDISSHISRLPVSSYQFHILLSQNHPLAQNDALSLSDLMGIPLTVAHNNEDSPYIKTLRSMFMPYGFSPRIDHLATMDSLCFEIASGDGVGIASPIFWKRLNARSAAFFERNIKAYPIPNEFYPVSLVWRAEDKDIYIENFIKYFQNAISRPENQELVYRSYH